MTEFVAALSQLSWPGAIVLTAMCLAVAFIAYALIRY